MTETWNWVPANSLIYLSTGMTVERTQDAKEVNNGWVFVYKKSQETGTCKLLLKAQRCKAAATHCLNYKDYALFICSGLTMLDYSNRINSKKSENMESFRSLTLLSMDALINSINWPLTGIIRSYNLKLNLLHSRHQSSGKYQN